ncbi:MAG: NlpC/P60 family protein [Pseudomonadota bacterium]
MTNFPELAANDRRLNLLGENGEVRNINGTPAAINVSFTDLRSKADFSAPIDTQLVFGETVQCYETLGDWTRVQADRDGYVGWLESMTLVHDPLPATHIVCAPRTFLYPEPDLKKPHKGMRSMGSALRIVSEAETRGTIYKVLETGEAVFAKHVRSLEEKEADYVSVAESLLRAPYLWAGTTAFGLDCSGLVQLAKFMCGETVLRDSDMQAASIGEIIDPGEEFEGVERGDLAFWQGHVGICQGMDSGGTQMLLHANAHSMDVTSEPLKDAVERIAYLYGPPTGFRRP